MSRKHKRPFTTNSIRVPRRGEIWHIVDRDETHNGREQNKTFKNSVQGGTRFCIVVSNNTINSKSSEVEVVYTTTKKKNKLPTHFITRSTPETSVVLCEQVTTVAKKDLTDCYGILTMNEKIQLDKCLAISVGLHKEFILSRNTMEPKHGEIYNTADGKFCVIVSNDIGNIHSPVVEVVYMTEKKVNCEQIKTISKEELTEYHRTLTDDEKIQLDKCLKHSLGL